MYPFIHTPLGEIPVFTIFVACGAVALLLATHFSLKGAVDLDGEKAFIYPRIVVCGVAGFVSAALTDFVFKVIEYGVVKVYGLTFYGGLIGAAVTLYILVRFSKQPTQYSAGEWLDRLTIPFLLFHTCGRLGCFFGGCCYGQYTDSPFAIAFPDNPVMGIFHFGQKCYPTQLYEAAALIVISVMVAAFPKHRFLKYLTFYGVIRFLLEFLRGDDRGAMLCIFSPSQWISIGVLLFVAVVTFWRKRHDQSV